MTNPAPATAAPWTVVKILQWTTDFFAAKGIEKARLEGEMLLADMLRKKRLDLYLEFDRPLDAQELKSFKERVTRRAQREPLQYILGSQAFHDLNLKVGPGVLIPRPETELLVEEVLKEVAVDTADLKILELGTGSGNIAIALALARPLCTVETVDISSEALIYARENLAAAGCGARVTVIQGDLFDAVEQKSQYYCLVSNPPYIRRVDLQGLQPEVKNFEPNLALDGGEDGLQVINQILARGPQVVSAGGFLFLEIGAEQGDTLMQTVSDSPYWENARVLKDLAGRARIFKAQRNGTPWTQLS